MASVRRLLWSSGLVLVAGGGLAVVSTVTTAEAGPTRQLPAQFSRSPYSLMSLSVGHPNDGWQVRSKQLRDGPFLRVRERTRALSYGHPALVLMLTRSAGDVARAYPGSVLFVGDLSAENGGPSSGHRSHQSGRDADVAFYMRTRLGAPSTADHFVAFGAEGTAKDGSGLVFDDARNWALVRSWLRDGRARVSHIFVSRDLRARLLAYGARVDGASTVAAIEQRLHQPRSSSLHDDHFHVRISCPPGQSAICHEGSR